MNRVPDWAREAASRPVPETDRGIVWLHEELIVEPLAEGGVRETSRLVGRILRRDAADEVGMHSLKYGLEDEVISFSTWTLMPDGTAREAVEDKRKGDIFDVPYVESASVYEDTRLRYVNAPGAVVGAVVAHESVVLRKLDLGARGFWFGFADYPTLSSKLTLVLPEGWNWEAARYRDEAIAVEKMDNGVSFVASDLKPLPWEEQRPPLAQVLPMIWIRWWSADGKRGFKDWDEVGRWIAGLAGPVLDEAGEAKAIAAGMKPAGPGDLLRAIGDAFDYVAREIRYVSIQIGIGGYKPNPPAEVIRNRYGDCKDKSWLLHSLLREWGADSYPVLVRTRQSGDLLTEVPTPAAFDHEIVAVKLPPGAGEGLWAVKDVDGLGRLLFLDGTASKSDAWTLPPSDQGTTALVVHPGGGALVELPIQPAEASVRSTAIEAAVDEQARFEHATVERECTGASAVTVRGQLEGLDSEQRRLLRETEMQDWFPGSSVSDYSATGLEDPEAPVVENFTLQNGRAGKRVYDLLLLEPGNLARDFLGRTLPPPPRRWDLWLGYPNESRAEVRFELPRGWAPEQLPDRYELRNGDVAVTAEWSVEDSVLLYRWEASLLTNEVPPERYEAFRDSVRQLTARSSPPIVCIQARP